MTNLLKLTTTKPLIHHNNISTESKVGIEKPTQDSYMSLLCDEIL